MYWRHTLFSLVILMGLSARAQNVQLSDQAEISIMTMGPYQGELYSAFGHSAIRLSDPVRKIDWVYNYGVFDFNQKNFFWNFARGKMLYKLGMSRYESFKNHYVRENRYVIEQRLNLTLEEKQQLVDFLAVNYKPENREYYYNYVYDNCATKIKEVIMEVFPGRVTLNMDYVEEGTTIRDLMDRYLTYQPWGDWIIDIGLGSQIDKKASPEEYMFLPDCVHDAFSGSTIERDGDRIPLVAKEVMVYQAKPEALSNSIYTPFNVFVLVFFFVGFFTNRDFKRAKRTKWIDPVLFTLAGLLGWWLVFLWLGTDHLSKYNYNLLWAIPFHIPFAYLLGVKKLWPFLSKYFFWVSVLYVLLLVGWALLPQPLHMGLIPLVLTMILRGFYIHSDLKLKLKRANR